MWSFYSTVSRELVDFIVNLCKGKKSWLCYIFIPVRCYALHCKLAWFCLLLTSNLLFSWLTSQNSTFIYNALTFFKVSFKFEVKPVNHRWEISVYYCLSPKVTCDYATGLLETAEKIEILNCYCTCIFPDIPSKFLQEGQFPSRIACSLLEDVWSKQGKYMYVN